MNTGDTPPKQRPGEKASQAGLIRAPWERAFERILTPFEEFISRQTTSGLLLIVTTVVVLLIANSSLAEGYRSLVQLPAALSIGEWSLEKSLQQWVNHGLMALYFFVIGMELKRELLVGELADLKRAALPIAAAIGGMIAPALIYLALNPEGDAARGWGIPMATDIAFAVGVLVLLAAHVPKALITFLVALAIIDDLGAVLVIALFYTQDLVISWLAAAAALFSLLIVFNLAGIRKVMPYFIVAALLWYALLQSGVHATLAGVLGAFSVPARPRYEPALFSARVKDLMTRFDSSHRHGASIMANDQLRGVVQALGDGVVAVQTPLQRLEHIWHLPVAFLVVPIFAFFNAGIPLRPGSFAEALADPVALGVTAGLLLGKFIGITAASALALRIGIAQLPTDTRFSQIAAVSLLAGIGFTMSFFIAELGFSGNPGHLLMAKTGVLAASLLCGTAGFVWLWLLGRARSREITSPVSPATK